MTDRMRGLGRIGRNEGYQELRQAEHGHAEPVRIFPDNRIAQAPFDLYHGDRGATFVEYSLMVMLIALAALGAAAALGLPVVDMFSSLGPFGGGGGGP